MARFGIVSAAQLAREGRWDASFHLALNELEPRVEALRKSLSAEAAKALLAGLPLKYKAPLKEIARGERPFNQAMADRVVNEYPHLSLALIEKHLGSAIATAEADVVQSRDVLDRLRALSADLKQLS